MFWSHTHTQAESLTELEQRRSEQFAGVGADTLLRTLLPVVERRLEGLLVELIQCEPDFERLLDLRAQIKEVVRIKQELDNVRQVGREASEALKQIFNPGPQS